VLELMRRHQRRQPYTWLNERVLLSVNPGRPLLNGCADNDLTSAAHRKASVASEEELLQGDGEEHLFGLAEAAARQAEHGVVATITCVGESGSGKTEAGKLALLHLIQRRTDENRMDDSRGMRVHHSLSLSLLLSRSVVEAFSHTAGPANFSATRLVLSTCLDINGHGSSCVRSSNPHNLRTQLSVTMVFANLSLTSEHRCRMWARVRGTSAGNFDAGRACGQWVPPKFPVVLGRG
jgi:hypothetical protein